MEKIQVFRIQPEKGKYYETAEYTEMVGSFADKFQYYYTSKPMKYVGEYIASYSIGCGQGADYWDIFDNNGVEVRVDYSDDGRTSFREVDKR